MTLIEDTPSPKKIPASFALSNYPNPFNPETLISYILPEKSNINLSIYNALGQKLETLETGEKRAGRHKIIWNTVNYSAGTYFYRLETSSGRCILNKMILLK